VHYRLLQFLVRLEDMLLTGGIQPDYFVEPSWSTTRLVEKENEGKRGIRLEKRLLGRTNPLIWGVEDAGDSGKRVFFVRSVTHEVKIRILDDGSSEPRLEWTEQTFFSRSPQLKGSSEEDAFKSIFKMALPYFRLRPADLD
jgi:hypothetical protein